jgi:hypothetical protein
MKFYQHTKASLVGVDRISNLPMVYVIATIDLKYIKVGYTVSPKQRFSNIQNGCPFDLSLWLAIRTPIPEQVEQHVHESLGDFNLRGEWFSPDDQGLDWLLSFFAATNRHIREVAHALV